MLSQNIVMKCLKKIYNFFFFLYKYIYLSIFIFHVLERKEKNNNKREMCIFAVEYVVNKLNETEELTKMVIKEW
ncbi:hypothetical protein PFNF54_05484 [Plasmodium falciparum NF54]|uniref:Uncharacterized protein n=1 Tax=Plasmodium falciparum (isolate NF54) TaxID=5843 RepID=W7K7S7_PLAFO|nr:hypothetical protein PFNF54_05484 [Plasmodium falciparum NF54]